MADPTVDVHRSIATELVSATDIVFVRHGKNGWSEKGWLELAPMGMARENPAVKSPPKWQIRSVWIVAKDDGWATGLDRGHDRARFEKRPPTVIETNQPKPLDIDRLILEDSDP